jgi:predicted DNA-binding antitoxin AbrB/MazE fold protein
VSKVIRVKYENGVLKPLDPIDLREGEELLIAVIVPDENRKKIVEKYKGFMGSASKEELDKLLLEAEFESF